MKRMKGTNGTKKKIDVSGVKRKPKPEKEVKPPRKRVDKSDPNWKLKPNVKIEVLFKVLSKIIET